MTPEEERREDDLILALCAEADELGLEPRDGETDNELIGGFRGNHSALDIADAASGEVAALLRLRGACGLPLFR